MTDLGEGPATRFRSLYAANIEAVVIYAVRRLPVPEDAADVAAEVFTVAWRRRDDLPPDGEARLWLFGVARKVLANHIRGEGRRLRLGERLRGELARRCVMPDPADEVSETADLTAALARLGELDREVLTLSVWEQLEPREIAAVLGLDPVVVRARLSRARARCRTEIFGARHVSSAGGHVPGNRSVPAGKETDERP